MNRLNMIVRRHRAINRNLHGDGGAIFGNFRQRNGNLPILKIFFSDNLVYGFLDIIRRCICRKGRHRKDQRPGTGQLKKIPPVEISRFDHFTQHIGFPYSNRLSCGNEPAPPCGRGWPETLPKPKLRLDVSVALLLQFRQFGDAGRHDVLVEHFVQRILAEFLALERVGADAEVDVLGL